jgi:hypothetical protein
VRVDDDHKFNLKLKSHVPLSDHARAAIKTLMNERLCPQSLQAEYQLDNIWRMFNRVDRDRNEVHRVLGLKRRQKRLHIWSGKIGTDVVGIAGTHGIPYVLMAITTGSAGCTAVGIGPAISTGPGSGPTDWWINRNPIDNSVGFFFCIL